MTYTVKEVFYTLQGEGANTGRPAVFLRFAGCNLWTGREEDRSSAICQFCDTDFLGGTKFATADLLAAVVSAEWRSADRPFVVITGGEPLLQLDQPLIDALHNHGFEERDRLALRQPQSERCVRPDERGRAEGRVSSEWNDARGF